jgi:ribosomal protein S18 acetylase RimI-like enzyme
MRLQLLTKTDAQLLAAAAGFFKQAPPDAAARFLNDPAAIAFVATEDGEIVGWTWGYRQVRPDGRDQVLLYEIETAAAWRRRGIGTELLRAVLDLARDEGFARVWLCTNEGNVAAVALYEAEGGQRFQSDDVVYRWDLRA